MSEYNPLGETDLIDVLRARINSGFDIVKEIGEVDETDAYKTLQFMEFIGLLQETHDLFAAAIYKIARP